jgi:hypothetical protein
MKRLVIFCLFIVSVVALFAEDQVISPVEAEYVNNLDVHAFRAHAFLDIGVMNPSFGNSVFLLAEGSLGNAMDFRLEGTASIGYSIASDHYIYTFGTSQYAGRVGVGVNLLSRRTNVMATRDVGILRDTDVGGETVQAPEIVRLRDRVPGEQRMG